MRSLLSLTCLSLLALILSGCGTPPERRLESPALRVKSLTPTADTYALQLEFINPNTAPLVVSRSTHTLYLGDTQIGRLDDRTPIGIPPLGGVPHSATLTPKLAAELRDYLAKHPGQLRASVESSLEVAVGDNDTITLKTAGTGLVTP